MARRRRQRTTRASSASIACRHRPRTRAGSRLDAIAGTASARNDRLEGAVHGSGWWRLQPQAATGRRLLLVFHPYSARLTVRLPPDYRVQRQSVFDRDLDARYSRRALVFPFAGDGPIYVGIEGARYPLQVAVRDIGSHAVSDRSHSRVLYTATGVLIGVCLVALVFWLILRDRVYLLYAGCMAMQLLYVLCAYGEAYALPGLRLLAPFGAPGVWFVATLSTIVAVYFLLDFGELRSRAPRLSRALLWIGALPAVAAARDPGVAVAGAEGLVPQCRQPVAAAGQRAGDRVPVRRLAARRAPCRDDAAGVDPAGGWCRPRARCS